MRLARLLARGRKLPQPASGESKLIVSAHSFTQIRIFDEITKYSVTTLDISFLLALLAKDAPTQTESIVSPPDDERKRATELEAKKAGKDNLSLTEADAPDSKALIVAQTAMVALGLLLVVASTILLFQSLDSI